MKSSFEYPSISDLYPLNKGVNSHSIRKNIKKLRKKGQQHTLWVKYDVTLTDYLDKDRMSKGLSDTITKVLTYTYPFHNNKRKLTFLKKLLLVLLEMNLAGEVGNFKGEFILYYKLMVLFPNYRSAETMHEELNETVNFVQNSGKAKPLNNRHKFDEAFKELIISIITEFQDRSTGRVNFLQTDNPYEIVERLERKPDLSPYSNLITLTSFRGSLSRGITLDYPCTFVMISDISESSSLYLAGVNTGYNNAKQVSNSIVQSYARSLRTFNGFVGGLPVDHPFRRSSNLRVLGWSSSLSKRYSSAKLKDSILQDLSQKSLHKDGSFVYDPDALIEEVLKKNYMLEIIDGPNLAGSTEVDLNRTQSELTFDENEGENKTDLLLSSIRRYFYANALDLSLSADNASGLEKLYKSGTKKRASAAEENKENIHNDHATDVKVRLAKGYLSKDLKTYLNLRIKKELMQLATIPREVELRLEWSSGKGKFNRLRKSKTVVEKAISDGDACVTVSMSRLLGLPVYSEIRRNRVYHDLFHESIKSIRGKEGQLTQSEFSQLTKNIKKHCGEYVKKVLDTEPSKYQADRTTCKF